MLNHHSLFVLISFALVGLNGPVFGQDKPVAYVGTEKCAQCHASQTQTYLQTTHSRSLHRIGDEGVCGVGNAKFDHKISGSRFEVASADKGLTHRETLVLDSGENVALTEFDMAYAVGSGQHAQTFLYQRGAILGESPLTWYRDRDDHWGMSPGYDIAHHPSFRREVDADCLHCHAGQIEFPANAQEPLKVTELAIGCERCHGPGADHVAKHESSLSSMAESIIHPDRLSREISEAICQQCHLQGAITVTASGQSLWDFRPGQSLTDNRSVYQMASAGDTIKIVGHVEQMHASKCYQETETLTCVTCHNPHVPLEGVAKIDAYRNACLSCHDDKSCGVPHQQRIETAKNDCSHCHMPATNSNVSHVALHHHRIGIHPRRSSDLPVSSRNELVSVLDESSLDKAERTRRKALGMIRLFAGGKLDSEASDFRERSVNAMFALYQDGMRNPPVMSTLAFDAAGEGFVDIARTLAEETLAMRDLDSDSRRDALRTLGKIQLDSRQYDTAKQTYARLTRESRMATDWYYLGLAEQNVGNTDRALEVLSTAIEIDPTFVSAHEAIRVILASLGHVDAANRHTEAIRRIDELTQQRNKAAQATP